MGLAAFIRQNRAGIVEEWEHFVAALPAAHGMSESELRNHVMELLDAVVSDMEAPQSRVQQDAKVTRVHSGGMESTARTHSDQRSELGFDLVQVLLEYRALRATVTRLWGQSQPVDLGELTRFNESIDEALTVAAHRHAEVVGRMREQFLAMLGHDLRSPLQAITLTAEAMSRSEVRGDPRAQAGARRIGTCAKRMGRLVNDLLDLTRTGLGKGVPISRRQTDLAALCREVTAELEAAYPGRHVVVHAQGDLRGEWDSDRLAQVVSNLVGNALQHGSTTEAVHVVAREDGDSILLTVHNWGKPIPESALSTLFEPMVRGPSLDQPRSSSLGLGLFIAREIVKAHGGWIQVISTAEEGTTFTVSLPHRSRN